MTIDTHTDLCWALHKTDGVTSGSFQVTAPKMREGGLNQVVAALYLSDGIQDQLGDEAAWQRIQQQFQWMMETREWIPFELALEGGRLLGPDVPTRTERLAWLSARDCRYITLTHNYDNAWIDSATDIGRNVGLTGEGRQLIRDLEGFHILSDVSHCSAGSISDVLDISSRPVIASHSGCRSITPHLRNLPNDLIIRIAYSGGVIGIPFATRFVESKEGVIRHIDHIAQLLGTTKNISIGSDLDGAQTVIKDASEWSFWMQPLLDKGYTQADIDGIAGNNFYRLIGGPPL